MDKPLVSICCITYNHAQYIRECLDGFLRQKTDFTFEVLIHDDASTDGTADIIREYQRNYPDIIKPILQKENRYSRGLPICILNYERVQGKYIALCEGDDYWTDPNKLQIQVDFMESRPEYSMCFHGCTTVAENDHVMDISKFGTFESREYTGKEVLATWMVPTASVMLRAEFIGKVPRDKDFWAGDIVVWLTMSKYGKLFGDSRKMSVYRRCQYGMTQKIIDMDPRKRYMIVRKHLDALYRYFPFITRRLYEEQVADILLPEILYQKSQKGYISIFRRLLEESLSLQFRIYWRYLIFRFTRNRKNK